jgi:hypothetical protein
MDDSPRYIAMIDIVPQDERVRSLEGTRHWLERRFKRSKLGEVRLVDIYQDTMNRTPLTDLRAPLTIALRDEELGINFKVAHNVFEWGKARSLYGWYKRVRDFLGMTERAYPVVVLDSMGKECERG